MSGDTNTRGTDYSYNNRDDVSKVCDGRCSFGGLS